MFVRCPHCALVHPTDREALGARRGHLDCPGCGREFDGVVHFSHSPDGLAGATVPGSDETADGRREAPLQGTMFAASGAVPAPIPGFARERRRRPGPRGGPGGWALAVGLLAALLLQIAIADRARLAANPRWRPALEATCRLLHCALPLWHAPAQLTLTSREVRPHPSVPGALLITATFRNDAPFAQVWPQLELALADLDGRPLALRRFTPDEYLGSAPAAPGLAPGQSASASLEVMDPGNRALAFAFEFR